MSEDFSEFCTLWSGFFDFNGERFTIREPLESAYIAFRAAQLQNAKLVDDKLTADADRMASSRSVLVAACTFRADGSPVSVEWVRANLPGRLISRLFDRLVTFLREDRDEAKKSPSATTS